MHIAGHILHFFHAYVYMNLVLLLCIWPEHMAFSISWPHISCSFPCTWQDKSCVFVQACGIVHTHGWRYLLFLLTCTWLDISFVFQANSSTLLSIWKIKNNEPIFTSELLSGLAVFDKVWLIYALKSWVHTSLVLVNASIFCCDAFSQIIRHLKVSISLCQIIRHIANLLQPLKLLTPKNLIIKHIP